MGNKFHRYADRTHKYITMDVMPVKPKILGPLPMQKKKRNQHIHDDFSGV